MDKWQKKLNLRLFGRDLSIIPESLIKTGNSTFYTGEVNGKVDDD